MGCASSAPTLELPNGDFGVQVQEERANVPSAALARENVFSVVEGSAISIGVVNRGPTVCDAVLYFGDDTKDPIGALQLQPHTGPLWIGAPSWVPEPQRFVAAANPSSWRVEFRPRRADLADYKATPLPFVTSTAGWKPDNGQVKLGHYAGPPPASLVQYIPNNEIDYHRRRTIPFRIAPAKSS